MKYLPIYRDITYKISQLRLILKIYVTRLKSYHNCKYLAYNFHSNNYDGTELS